MLQEVSEPCVKLCVHIKDGVSDVQAIKALEETKVTILETLTFTDESATFLILGNADTVKQLEKLECVESVEPPDVAKRCQPKRAAPAQRNSALP